MQPGHPTVRGLGVRPPVVEAAAGFGVRVGALMAAAMGHFPVMAELGVNRGAFGVSILTLVTHHRVVSVMYGDMDLVILLFYE